MTRLILFLLLFAVAVLAISAVVSVFKPVVTDVRRLAAPKEDTMPATFRLVAYVLLLVLMVGVATGWMGSV